jgi:hypothetical protein
MMQYFPSLVPLMMFISHALTNRLWHNDTPRACLIVDDPLLTDSYGFLDYRKLQKVMEREQFCTSIAFIPWNYRRSNRQVAEFLKTNSNRYSLCVHGCDHTGGEFGSTNHLLLREKAQQALDRMKLHQQLSGLYCDRIMVFPQGVFSTAAIRALKSCDYLAAVNTTSHPVNFNDTLTVRDLMEVAVMRFSNFPVFLRHYPQDLAELAFDLFLGKPALLVEHHGYFKRGYDSLAQIVEKVNALDERMEWRSLEKICSSAGMKRKTENGDIHMRFFTDRFCLRNDTDQMQNYVLFRRQLPEEPFIGVTINGRRADSIQETYYLKIPLSLDAGQTAEIVAQCGRLESQTIPLRNNPIHTAKVFIRRRLSEFRDNYVERSRWLHKTVTTTRNLFTRGN